MKTISNLILLETITGMFTFYFTLFIINKGLAPGTKKKKNIKY